MRLFKKIFSKKKRQQVDLQVLVSVPASVTPTDSKKPIPLPLSIFPDNVLIQLLREVISTEGVEVASKFIAAFPDHLAHLVLIVSDSPTDHYFLAPHMPKTVQTIGLLDFCDKPWVPQRLIPIRILAYSEPESFAISYYLNNLVSCPYARFMTPWTPVVVEAYTTTGMPFQLIKKHAETQGVRNFEFRIILPYESAELDGLRDGPPTLESESFTVYNRTAVPLTLYRDPSAGTQKKFMPKTTVTLLDVFNYQDFTGYYHFPKLQILRARFDSKCRYNGCLPKTLAITSGEIQSVYISFSNSLGVAIDDSSVAGELFEGNEPRGMFMFINEDWSFTNPYGRKMCNHHTEAGIFQDQANFIARKSSNLLRFTGRFSDFYFVGVPDMTLLNCAKNWALVIKWKRLSPSEDSEQVMDTTHTITALSCTHLTIFNKIHLSYIDQNPMSVFDAPRVQSLSLFALEGSAEPWSLDMALNDSLEYPDLLIIHMSTLEQSSESSPPMMIHGQALALSCLTLEELHMMGYTPGFCLHPLPPPLFLNDVCFHKLDFLRLDVSSIPRTNDNIDLSFPNSRFPSLLTVCFDLYDDMNISGFCPPWTKVTIHEIPDTFRQVNINTMVRSQFTICGKTVGPFDGEVRLGNYAAWTLKKDGGWEVTEILKEKSYKQWIYEQ